MLSRVLFQSKNVFLRTQPIILNKMCRNMSQEREELVYKPPPLPVLLEDGKQNTDIREFDPKQESLESFLNIRFGPEMATINDDNKPERDRENFPRLIRPVWPEKTRLFVVPDSWFQMFYNRTGVTGPYAFGLGFITFLLSKEFFVIEHEFVTGVCLAVLTFAAIKKFGKPVRHFILDVIDEECRQWDNWQKGMIAFLEELINTENKLQNSSKNQKILFDAKRENIKLQLEAEFRRRQMLAFNEVRNRLEFQIGKQVAQKQYEQKHMVNWIIDNVAKSISEQHERDILKKCLSDLKQLSAKHQISLT